SIARVESDHSFPDTISLAEKQIQSSEKINLPGFRGSLADELSNIRFAGENDAALDALKQFSEYKNVSANVTEQEKNGAHAEAVKNCLSFSPSGSKFSFTRFDDALLRTLKINQVQMDKAVASAFKALKRLDLEIEFVCLLTFICVYLGLLPRMEEYVHCDASRAKHKH
ncbi:MAG: hypothetical protein K2X81_04030, partial [Candidatus Obscuribacterales bacterium]|nr:hypothetical protein [Candidatus Obscuribacterales bacterium]